jgi:membrane protein DedA with SNARE-associated domain
VSYLMEQIAQFMQQLVAAIGYPGIALVMLLENVFPPIPSEVIMPFSGFLAQSGRLSFVGAWLAGTFGSVAGGLVLYGVGRSLGDPILRQFLRRYGRWVGISEGEYDRALRVFARYGDWVILFGRLIPLVRSLISIPAGMSKMPLLRFTILTALGSSIWNFALIGSGLILGSQWERVLFLMDEYQTLVLIVMVLPGLAFAVYLYRVWSMRRITITQEITISQD